MNHEQGPIPGGAQNFQAGEPTPKTSGNQPLESSRQKSIDTPEKVLHQYAAEKYENHLRGVEISLQGFFVNKEGRPKLDAMLTTKESDPQAFALLRQKTIDFYSRWAVEVLESQSDVRAGIIGSGLQEVIDKLTVLRPYVIDRITKTIDQIVESMSQHPR